MAISGTMETPIPAPTMLRRLLNWPLSKAICGWRRARPQAAMAVSRKQGPARRTRNGSGRKFFREKARGGRGFVFFGGGGEEPSGHLGEGFEFVAREGSG